MENNLMIAVCGLDCGKCEARIATVTNDEALKRKVAREWSELNKVLITPGDDLLHRLPRGRAQDPFL